MLTAAFVYPYILLLFPDKYATGDNVPDISIFIHL
ncbi:hypothetical protein CLOL250_02854 [Clostridium sp. L2-50]|nr:hypothetical protein CLOL250_02854 [Clostridium sp. L2-50]